jgi:hypothetical protein
MDVSKDSISVAILHPDRDVAVVEKISSDSESVRRLRPMRGLKTDHSVAVIVAGHTFIQNLRRGHYELGMQAPAKQRLADAFDELARAI